MERTPFAGLTALAPGESTDIDNASFKQRNMLVLDRVARIGVVTHRHNAAPALDDPTMVASASGVASGGAIPADTSMSIGYTLHDDRDGETLISPLVMLTTELPLDVPDTPPSAEVVYNFGGGALPADTYYYAISLIDLEGGETPISNSVTVEREPGYASGLVELSGLDVSMNEVGAAGWRLWRAVGNGDFYYIASGAGSGYVDMGGSCVDCGMSPVDPNQNFTNGDNSVLVRVPSGGVVGASGYSVYISTTGGFDEPSLMGRYPSASAGTVHTYRNLNAQDESPPPVSTSWPGASKIDPDTELLDYPWKRPVDDVSDLPATTEFELRWVRNEGAIYWANAGAEGPGDWALGAGGGGSSFRIEAEGGASGESDPDWPPAIIDFKNGQGIADIYIEDNGIGDYNVTIDVPDQRAQRQDINGFARPRTSVNWGQRVVQPLAINNGYRLSSGAASGAQIRFDFPLASGVYALEMVHMASGDAGIVTVYLDNPNSINNEVGEINQYASGVVWNRASEILDIPVFLSKVYHLKLVVEAKDGASSGFFANFAQISLVRTG